MSKALHPNQLRPGDRIREYRLLRRLGTGGFSLVFLVEHEGSLYALKIALQPVSDADEDHVDGWMRREAVSLEHLAHPNLLPVHELGRWPQPRTGYSFYVTDYVPGATFHEWRWRRRATPYHWVGVLCEALSPLEALHERGLCHRDIKADNVLVREEDDRPFLIDFGAVHLPCARPLTEGLAPGTIYCQPPEAIRFLVGEEVLQKGSRLEAHPSADLYAVGILIYEALTGRHPFDPKLPLKQLLVAILSTTPSDPRQLNPEAPASLSALAMRLLEKEPGQRPPSVRAVREELERLRAEEGHTAPWRTPSLPLSGDGGAEEGPGAPEPARREPEPAPSGEAEASVRARWAALQPKVLLALVLGLGLLGLGWGLFARWMPRSEEASPLVESTAPASPEPAEQGAPPMQSSQNAAPSRLCALIHAVLGVAVAQFVGCVTTPAVRPDPVGYLASCSPQARATPKKLGLKPEYLYPTLLRGAVTPASSSMSIDDGGPLNLKPGPVTALMFPYPEDKYLLVSGEAVTTRNRVYIQFDRVQLPDGSWLPICGAAVSTFERVYGIPTREGIQFPDRSVDAALVDHSPGSVVLNDPRFDIAIQPPEGEPEARVRQVDPEAPPDIKFAPVEYR